MVLRRSAREWLYDVAVTAAAALLSFLLVLGARSDPDPDPALSTDLAFGGAALTLLFLLRRRRPLLVWAVLMAGQLFSTSAMGPLGLTLFTIAVHRSWWVAVTVAGVEATFITLAFTASTWRSEREYWETLAVFLLGIAVLVAAGMLVRSRRQLIDSWKERALQAEMQHQMRVEEARHLERERIAREMHDVLAHRISLLAVHAGALEFGEGATERQREAAGVIRRCAYEAMEDLREVIGVLRDDGADAEQPQPTLTDVPALVEESRRAGTPITFDDRVTDPESVPTSVGRHAFRVVQEGLTNARKHAPGCRVRVRLAAAESGLAIEIVNPLPAGRAATALPGAGAGLIGLRERAELVGGRLEHGRTPEDAFVLRAWLPLPSR
ncbi:two-component sensor histidine kinase [Actinomadura sp. NBRC 104425]|uniref:sensor histidine kinase n=1 Tax=Actinomadura sp. NBRC 104425 TaxID=3032204 RepID=UPI0024A28D05|nr:histidine kinase [Actinomadura sp. NBRC 104425]GLZ13878.1 two-component sensor histidine kinase [Actinomadura sp. NBRC 104425]